MRSLLSSFNEHSFVRKVVTHQVSITPDRKVET